VNKPTGKKISITYPEKLFHEANKDLSIQEFIAFQKKLKNASGALLCSWW
jgi:hypothetical protein